MRPGIAEEIRKVAQASIIFIAGFTPTLSSGIFITGCAPRDAAWVGTSLRARNDAGLFVSAAQGDGLGAGIGTATGQG